MATLSLGSVHFTGNLNMNILAATDRLVLPVGNLNCREKGT